MGYVQQKSVRMVEVQMVTYALVTEILPLQIYCASNCSKGKCFRPLFYSREIHLQKLCKIV